MAYLLHLTRPTSFDMICDKLAPADLYKKTYAKLTYILQDCYASTPLEIIENYRFRLRKQAERESIHNFVAALYKYLLQF